MLAVPLAARTRTLPAASTSPDGSQGHDVAEAARNAAAEALDRGETHYTDRPGIEPLRRAVASHVASVTHMALAPSDAVITCGVTEARFVAVQRLASDAVPVVAFGHRDRLEGACAIRGVPLLDPSDAPDQPSLLYLPEDAEHDARSRAIDHAKQHGSIVVYDLGAVWNATPLDTEAHELATQTVCIGDLGAAFGADAWRIGFLTAPTVQVGALRDFKQALTICTTALSQWGTLALVEAQV